MPRSSGPLPADPYGKQSAIPITVKVTPPKVQAEKVNPADYIVYPHHLVFTSTPVREPMSDRRAGLPVTARQQREGDVCRTFANFRVFGAGGVHKDDICRHHTVRFLGVSYDGITDYKAAMQTPDASGRYSVGVSGNQTVFADTRSLQGAHIGDVIFWKPEPSDFVWSDGHREFHPPALGYISRDDFPHGGSGFGSGTGPGVEAVHDLACSEDPSPWDYIDALRGMTVITEDEMGFLREQVHAPWLWDAGFPKDDNGLDKVKGMFSEEERNLLEGIDDITDIFSAMYAIEFDTKHIRLDGQLPAAITAADGDLLQKLAQNAACPNVKFAAGADKTEILGNFRMLLKKFREENSFGTDTPINPIFVKLYMDAYTIRLPEPARAATLSDFGLRNLASSIRSSAIQTAAAMAPSIDRSSSKRIRTGLRMSGQPGCGNTNKSRAIGTLIELGDWSGRKNECTILIDPRLSLL